jgi:hypothetical protein
MEPQRGFPIVYLTIRIDGANSAAVQDDHLSSLASGFVARNKDAVVLATYPDGYIIEVGQSNLASNTGNARALHGGRSVRRADVRELGEEIGMGRNSISLDFSVRDHWKEVQFDVFGERPAVARVRYFQGRLIR